MRKHKVGHSLVLEELSSNSVMQVALLSTSLQHVESERNELAKKLEEVERQHAVLHQQYIDAAVANEAISPAKYQQLQDDMALLQVPVLLVKFIKVFMLEPQILVQ